MGYLLRLAFTLLAGLAGTLSEVVGGEKKQSTSFDSLLQRLNGVTGKISDSTERKAAVAILNTQIVVMSESPNHLRWRSRRTESTGTEPVNKSEHRF